MSKKVFIKTFSDPWSFFASWLNRSFSQRFRRIGGNVSGIAPPALYLKVGSACPFGDAPHAALVVGAFTACRRLGGGLCWFARSVLAHLKQSWCPGFCACANNHYN